MHGAWSVQCLAHVGEPEPGARVGDYVIEAELTTRPGVYASTHRLLPRRAHIIASLSEPAASSLACILEQLRHPAVPRIYELGQLEDRRPWLAVAVIEGPTLAERIAAAPLPVVETAALLRDLATVLAHAHGHGIVHGGLCADHVALTLDGWKIVDWTEAGRADDHATDTTALGTLAYAALARALPTSPITHRCPGVPVALARMIDGLLSDFPMPAERVAVLAAQLVEDLAQPEPSAEDSVPIAIEDIVLLDVSRPPPVPMKLRVRAQGTGPVTVTKGSGHGPDKKES